MDYRCRNCLHICSTVYENTLKKVNSKAYIIKTYHGTKQKEKPLPISTFVLKRNFLHVHFSDKLKPLRIGPYKVLDRLFDVTYEFLPKLIYITCSSNHLILYYPKEPLVHIKFLTDYLTLHTKFSHKMALQYMFIETISSLIIQKNHFCTHIYVVSCASQTQPH